MVAAHPDDETLGAGGTLALLSRRHGAEVSLAVVSDGSSAQHGDDMDARNRRNAQMREAADILGIGKIYHGTFPDMRLETVPHIEINKWLSNVVEESQCDLVFTHHHGDVNLDHSMVFRSTLVATRPTPGKRVRGVLSYYVGSSSEWSDPVAHKAFMPNVFVDISDTIDAKIDALNAYVDEIRPAPHPRNAETLRAMAQVTGAQAGVPFAEGFVLIRGLF
ncbi:LmbE-like protein [Pseudooceanicola batsensis HTCC2597]|uniref:LmbE-like protein n=1 Tax=Pseudooceanicola batsensis (strain ATCC BAA-863 / DSM 15984 / KCTC 12145 / HTCC2597) TaxID=252305 RepID=A3TU91_PSEBH|nr:LmbE-like protein [Pseudooceanicola batsensis HTCC2597]